MACTATKYTTILNLNKLHPNLNLMINDSDLGEFIGELLQAVENLDENQAPDLARLEEQKLHLKQQREQLEREQKELQKEKDAFRIDQEKLLKFQSFIMKYSKQLGETEAVEPEVVDAPLKRFAGNNQA